MAVKDGSTNNRILPYNEMETTETSFDASEDDFKVFISHKADIETTLRDPMTPNISPSLPFYVPTAIPIQRQDGPVSSFNLVGKGYLMN